MTSKPDANKDKDKDKKEEASMTGSELGGSTKIDAVLLEKYCAKFPAIKGNEQMAVDNIKAASLFVTTLASLRGASLEFWQKLDTEVARALRETFIAPPLQVQLDFSSTADTAPSIVLASSGLTFLPNQPITHRSSAVEFLITQAIINHTRVVLIRAPPGSGKTSLAQLLARYVKAKGWHGEFIDLVSFSTIEDFQQLNDKINAAATVPRFLILDEAQTAYQKSNALPFWMRLKAKSGNVDDTPNVYVIAFASYGNTPSQFLPKEEWLAMVEQANSPGHVLISAELAEFVYNDIPKYMGVLDKVIKLITCQPLDHPLTSSELSASKEYEYLKMYAGMEFTPFGFSTCYGVMLLHATPTDFQEYMDSFNKITKSLHIHLQISSVVANYLYKLTGGHLGFTYASLHAIYDEFSSKAKNDPSRHPESTVSDSMICFFIRSYRFLTQVEAFRARPDAHHLTSNEKNMIVTHLFYAQVPLPMDMKDQMTVYALFRRGLLFYVDGAKDQGYRTMNKDTAITAPLIKLLCYVELFSANKTFARPLPQPATISNVLPLILEQLDASIIKNTLGVGVDDVTLERVWQMEFYRAAAQVLPSNSYVSPEVGGNWGILDRCDFFVNNSFCWLFEITREGIKVDEHLGRFHKPKAGDARSVGKYLPIPHKDYAVVDIYSKEMPVTYLPQDPHYWRVRIETYPTGIHALIQHRDDNGQVVDLTVRLVGQGERLIATFLQNFAS